MKKIYFKSNLKHLIKIYDDTNLDLALYLDYNSASAISNMINRSNNDYPSDPQLIEKICQRYQISREMLLYEDLSYLKKAYMFEIDEEKQIEFYKYIFPIIVPKEDDSQTFVEAYTIHSNLLRRKDVNLNALQEINNIYELYVKEFNSNNNLSALANILSILVLSRTQEGKEYWIKGYLKLKNNTINDKTFKKDYFLNVQTESTEKFESNDLDDLILLYIEILKQHEEYQEFADFYLAIRYFLNIAQEGLNQSQSANIARYLLSDLVCLHNKYALDFFVHKQIFEEQVLINSQTVKEK